jgi:signal transduction histidine kinase
VQALSAAEERNRLAREIHDGLGHYLTAMAVQARVVEALLTQDPAQAGEALDRLQFMIQEGLADLRRAVATLHSAPPAGINLPAALELLLEESRATGLACKLAVYGRAYPLSLPQEQALYRVVQEGLTNVRKHAQASRADLQLEYWPEEVILAIRDDGVGCTLTVAGLDARTRSFGLFGMRQRVQLLGGSLDIQTAPRAGFSLEVRLPRPSSSDHQDSQEAELAPPPPAGAGGSPSEDEMR